MFKGLRNGLHENVRDDQSLGAELQQKVALEQRHPERGPEGGAPRESRAGRVVTIRFRALQEECLVRCVSLG